MVSLCPKPYVGASHRWSDYLCSILEPVKPDSTPLTAHRLITGALGISAQMSKERVDEEKQKLQEAKGNICD